MALFVLLVLREELFYWLKVMLAGDIKALGNNLLAMLLVPVKIIVDALYMLWPTFSPYEGKMERLSNSLRGSDADWTYLLLAVTYLGRAHGDVYFLTGYELKKKRYV